MSKLVWCAINVSEGRNHSTLASLQQVCERTEGVELWDLHVGKTVNRSVFSVIARQNSLLQFARNFFSSAITNIDMQMHKGSHPRVGAVDVFPIVPLNESTYEETNELAQLIAGEINKQFQLAFYYYEQSQKKAYRKRLEQIRKGNYEALAEKLKTKLWYPDIGSVEFNARSGITVIGTRKPLIAINFSLKHSNLAVAKEIAGKIRASNKNSSHSLAGVKAIGWKIPEYNTVQVSVNSTDSEATSLKQLFDTINSLAEHYNTEITKSELIGLIPHSVLCRDFNDTESALKYFYLYSAINANIRSRIIDLNNTRLKNC